MKTTLLKFALCLLLTASIFACGGGEKAENKEDTTKTEEKTEKETPKPSVSGEESSCTETAIALKGDDFSMDNFKAVGLQVYNDQMQSDGTKYPALILTMTNYPKEGDYASEPVKENDVKLTIAFNGKSGSVITAQAYDIAGDGFGKSDKVGVNFNTKDRTYALNLPTGKAEITYLSAEKICGTVDVQDKSGKITIKGTFSCNLK
jgi:hypothetical protein